LESTYVGLAVIAGVGAEMRTPESSTVGVAEATGAITVGAGVALEGVGVGKRMVDMPAAEMAKMGERAVRPDWEMRMA